MITREQLDTANEMIKKIDFKGKGYALVASRVSAFRAICPRGRITTDILSLENGVVTMKATVYDDDDRELANGYAQEKEGASCINKTSFIENCETSAIGRALGNLGIGSDENISSAEELANAVLNQNEGEKKQTKKQQKTDETQKPEKSDEQKNAEMVAGVNPLLVPNGTGMTPERLDFLHKEMERTGVNEKTLLGFAQAEKFEDMSEATYIAMMNKLSHTKNK